MTPNRTIHLWLLTLTFLVGQWLVFVHGTEHAVSAGDQLVACEICVAHHASAPPPAADLPLAVLPVQLERPAILPLPLPQANRVLLPPSRGPPITLV